MESKKNDLKSIVSNWASTNLLDDLRHIIDNARRQAYMAINKTMVEAYWEMGKRIVEEEQNGNVRAEYGKQLLKKLSKALTQEYGKGFSTNQLYYIRQFYVTFKGKFPTACGILTWSHYKRLLSVENEEARDWYLKEAAEQMWSYATLNRNISSMYYERLLMSQQKGPVEHEMKMLTKSFDNDKLEFIKNPMVTEFLGIGPAKSYLESELEKSILNKLEAFLLELGKGFSFVERQKLVRTEKKDYFIDLVFYNFRLKCFMLIDLKVGKVTHEDIGQMEMYVNMYDKLVKDDSDNPTLGIVLCSETDADIAQYLLNDSKNIYMSKYLLCLPTQEELRREIEQQKAIFALQNGNGESNVEI